MNRGPKISTPSNSPPRLTGETLAPRPIPTSELSENALAEFERLVDLLISRGCLEMADVGVITAAARCKDRIDQLTFSGAATTSDVCQAENVYLGRLRALGLTMLPSRIHVRTIGQDAQAKDPIEEVLRIHG